MEQSGNVTQMCERSIQGGQKTFCTFFFSLNIHLLEILGVSKSWSQVSSEVPATVGTVGWSSTREEAQQNLKGGL